MAVLALATGTAPLAAGPAAAAPPAAAPAPDPATSPEVAGADAGPGERVAPPAWPVDATVADGPAAGLAPDLPAATAAADGPTTASSAVPSPDVHLVGSGWGHSVGMSQHGAQSMALAGRDVGAILRHYYTGVELAPWPATAQDGAEVAVNLFERRSVDPTRVDVRALSRGGGAPTTAVRLRVGDRTVVVPDDAAGVRLVVRDGSVVVLRHGGEVARGPRATMTPDAPAGADPAVLSLPQLTAGGPRLRGSFAWGRLEVSVSPRGGGRLEPVLHQSLEHYLDGLAEVPASWAPAALEAQAVAGRTYVAGFLGADPGRADCRCHVGATPAWQNYAGYEREAESQRYGDRWRRAVDATRGQVVTSGGRLAATYYSSSHGGRSEASEDSWAYSAALPHLRSIDDPWSLSDANPLRRWEATLSGADVARLVGLASLDGLVVLDRTAGGSPRTLRASGLDAAGQRAVVDFRGRRGAGIALRTDVPLRSVTPSSMSWLTRIPSTQVRSLRVGRFGDDDGSVHAAAVERLAAAGLTSGCSAGDPTLFCPQGPVTRGQLATMLVRALHLPLAPPAARRFSDSAASPHGDAAEVLAARGLADGFGDGTFRPGSSVTRAQAATLLARALSLPAVAPDGRFSDVVGSVHGAGIAALASAGLTTGCRADAYCPEGTLTRGQAASLLVRARLA